MSDIKFGDHLNSINTTKINIIRDGGQSTVAEKTYSPFLVARSLSYHADCILIVNELNIRGRSEHNLSNKMHYEFLLYSVEKKKRWAKWAKQDKDDTISLIMDKYKYSYEKALEVVDLFSDDDIEHLKRGGDTGGVSKDAPQKKAPKPRSRK